MVRHNEKIAASLEVLHDLQIKGRGEMVFQSSQFSRTHRERLIKHGFLREVIKGWLITNDPKLREGDSTTWYASFWTFVSAYLGKRFGNDYCLSPEASLLLHTGASTIPKQVTVMTRKSSGQVVALPHSTTLLLYDDAKNFPQSPVQKEGTWIMGVEEALCRVSPSFFEHNPIDAEIALRSIKEPSQLLSYLLKGGHSVIAGRLIGAYQFLGEEKIATLIKRSMEAADYTPKAYNPFSTTKPTLGKGFPFTSPYCARLEALWSQMRETILSHFPEEPGMSQNPSAYLQKVEEGYLNDAYNSLSIEGYKVTPSLIDQVRGGSWDPDHNTSDRDAMAAKGYHMTFQAVKKSILAILSGENPGDVIERDVGFWYLELFSPMVQAGILKVHQLSGYRNHPVYIKDSMHVPPASGVLSDAMETYWMLLKQEKSAAVRAVLGHFIFVYIHPYGDGNGRIGRFIMNSMFASGGYPWCVIPLSQRKCYMATLEAASTKGDITDFSLFVRDVLSEGGREVES